MKLKLDSRTVFGLFIILLGVGYLFDKLNIWDFERVFSNWWPLLIILWGMMHLRRSGNNSIGGLVLIIIGILLINNNIGFVNLHLISELTWPALIILIGVWLIVGRNYKQSPFDSSNTIHTFNVFSGLKNKNTSQMFEGGSVTTFFGGAEVDLRDADLLGYTSELSITAGFGGIEILVPGDWKVEVIGIPLFGGIKNKTRTVSLSKSEGKTLKVSYFVMFGGIEIKN